MHDSKISWTRSLRFSAQLPFWVLVSFGSYMLFNLGLGIYSINDVPEAYDELKKEIEMARTDLRTRGVDVD